MLSVLAWLFMSPNNQDGTIEPDTKSAVSFGLLDGWAKNVGKETKNTVNDAVQSAMTFEVFALVGVLITLLLDVIFKAPYFIIMEPRLVIATIADWLVITPRKAKSQGLSGFEFLVYWAFMIAFFIKFLYWLGVLT